MLKKFTVEWLKESENGIDVSVLSPEGHRHIIKNVHPNVVRCAIGEADTEYLLSVRNAESFCKLSKAEIDDFIKHVVR